MLPPGKFLASKGLGEFRGEIGFEVGPSLGVFAGKAGSLAPLPPHLPSEVGVLNAHHLIVVRGDKLD